MENWGGKRLIAIIFFMMLVMFGQVAAANSMNTDHDNIHLQILTVNDFHGALAENGKNPGAAALAAFLNQARGNDEDSTLLVSAGDMFQGTVDSNLLYGKNVVDVMNYARFDAMTLGNHEFDWGMNVLKQRIEQSDFPYVCANVLQRADGKPLNFVKPYVLVERSGIKIAIIGLATPETSYKTNPKMIQDVYIENPAKVVQALVPVLKRQGADIIVLLTHLGSWQDKDGHISGEAAHLALLSKRVDAIVSGHSHQIVHGKVNGVPIVQAGYNGRAVGKIELVINKKSHEVTNSSVSVTLLPFAGLPADPKAQGLIDNAQQELSVLKSTVVGRTEYTLSHDRRQPIQTLLGQWVTDVMRQAENADIAFQNTGGLRSGISAGPITMAKLYEVLPFDNTLFTVQMTGRQVMKVLQYGLMNDKVGTVQYSGCTVVYDAAQPPGKRITVTMSDGTPLSLTKTYKVATNDFMAAGGDGFTMFKEGKNLHDTGRPLRDLLVDTLRNLKRIDFNGDARWNPITKAGQQPAA